MCTQEDTLQSGLYPFVPSGRSFATAIEFFAELGFVTLWENSGLAGLRFGGAYFMLQDIDMPEWQQNQMITIEVDDLDLYWSEIETKDLPGRSLDRRAAPGRRPSSHGGASSTSSTRRRVLARA